MHQSCARLRTAAALSRATAPSRGQRGRPLVAAVLRTWQADVKADVLTARLLIVFIALQLAAALIRHSSYGRDGGDAAAAAVRASRRYRSPKLANQVRVARTTRMTKPRAMPPGSRARRVASLASVHCMFIGQRCSLRCSSSRDSGGMCRAQILHGHARAGADSEWDDGDGRTGVLSACVAPP